MLNTYVVATRENILCEFTPWSSDLLSLQDANTQSAALRSLGFDAVTINTTSI
jgi:hypothetical protein